MTYSIKQAEIIADQLERLATQNTYQLAGQVANIDFWIAEAVHAVRTIDDYPARFQRLRDAQVGWVEEHGTKVSNYATSAAVCVSSDRRQRHRHRLFGSTHASSPLRETRSDLQAAGTCSGSIALTFWMKTEFTRRAIRLAFVSSARISNVLQHRRLDAEFVTPIACSSSSLQEPFVGTPNYGELNSLKSRIDVLRFK